VHSVRVRASTAAAAPIVALPKLSARDAVHAAVMLNHDVHHIATFDHDVDRVQGVEWLRLT
jgi:predicted nucleic acid-binding protein